MANTNAIVEVFDRPATADEIDGASPYVKAGFRLLFPPASSPTRSTSTTPGTTRAGPSRSTSTPSAVRPRPATSTTCVDQLAAGRDYHDIGRALVFSTEGRNAFVRDIYRQLLRRSRSADRAYWGGELTRGVSPERLVTLIAGSAEYRASTQA